ncbi:MAG: hypothetical protein ABFS18_12255 [Thermodesulfobacteriota bacterium]
MEKFDPDFALFGILTADLSSGSEIGKAEVVLQQSGLGTTLQSATRQHHRCYYQRGSR